MKAEKSGHSGSRQMRLVSELWKALGVDPESTPNHLTLGEIGLESMFAVELQQELEREFNMKMSIKQIKSITVGLLKDYENGKTEQIKKFIGEMKRGREILCHYNFTIPVETHTKLNNVTTGRTIYFLPPIETNFSAFDEFAKKFDRPVIGLNWIKDMNQFGTINEINRYFTDLLKKLEPKGDYDLVGYLDGGMVVAKQLIKGKVKTGVIIDIIHDDRYLSDNVSEDVALEVVFSTLASEAPASFREKLKRDIFAEKTTSAKIKKMVEEIKDFADRGLIAPDLEEIITIAMKRALISWDYRVKKKSKLGNKLVETIGKKWAKIMGKLHVIKAFSFDNVEDVEEKVNSSRDAYLLPGTEVIQFETNIACVDNCIIYP